MISLQNERIFEFFVLFEQIDEQGQRIKCSAYAYIFAAFHSAIAAYIVPLI